jgi:hypothetical protein
MKRAVTGVIAMGVLILAQLVPYGRSHPNPPIQQEPPWNLAETRVLSQRACFDCHSNETKWPWYSNVAPVSWLIQRDVDEGRLNLSEWNRPQKEGNEAARTVEKGEMPPRSYVVVHPEARLELSQRDVLIRGLQATVAAANRRSASINVGRQRMKHLARDAQFQKHGLHIREYVADLREPRKRRFEGGIC